MRVSRLFGFAVFMLSVGAVQAECAYPDSNRGDGPNWLCGSEEFEGARFLAVGDKSRMPSISLQNRLAGKDAMSGVVVKLLAHAKTQLQTELPATVELHVPSSVSWAYLARFKGINVLDKAISPQRHLYVLAGVPPELSASMIYTARRELLAENKKLILAALGQAGWRKLNAPVDKPAAQVP